MRSRSTFIAVYRYRKTRHAVLSRRGASIASHFAMRRSGVRSPSAPPPQVPTLSRQSAYCRSRCRTSLGQLVLQVVLLGGQTPGQEPLGGYSRQRKGEHGRGQEGRQKQLATP